MQGTAQFMAAELLHSFIAKLKKFNPPLHQVHHDLESIIWVLGYAVMRHTHTLIQCDPVFRNNDELKDDWDKVTVKAFGHVTFDGIYVTRTTQMPLLFYTRLGGTGRLSVELERLISLEMRDLLKGMRMLIYKQHGFAFELPVVNMSYEDVLGAFDKAIVEMEAAAGQA